MVCDCAPVHQLDSMADEELVELARSDCPGAFDALVERHYETFRRIALKLMKNEPDAHDIVQSAFVTIFAKLDSYSGRGSFAGWAYRIVRNTGLMTIRKRKRRRETDIENAPPSAYEPAGYQRWSTSPDRALDNKEIRTAVKLAMSQLEPKYRAALELREFDGLTMAQMSEELGLTVGGVKTRLHRARSHMRVWLEDQYGVAPGPVR